MINIMFRLYETAPQRRTPLDELESFQRDFMRIFNRSSRTARSATGAAANLWVNREEGVLAIEAPGATPEDIEVNVVGPTVSVRFHRTETPLGDSDSYVRKERGVGEYSRTFELPFAIDAQKVEARYDNGVIQVKLPSAEAEKPAKIAVTVQ